VVSRDYVEAARLAVGFHVTPRDELVAREDRHAVVAIFPVVRRLEDLEYLFEAEKNLDAVTVPQ